MFKNKIVQHWMCSIIEYSEIDLVKNIHGKFIIDYVKINESCNELIKKYMESR